MTSSRRSAGLVATTVFPLLVLAGAVAGFFLRDAVTPLSWTIPWILGIIMFCMGLTLTAPDVQAVIRRPGTVALGVVTQYGIMPLAAFAVSWALSLPPELALGVILVGCAPGGTASNVITYLARGDVALSVAITTVTTLLAPFVMPPLALLFAGEYLTVSAGSLMIAIAQTVLLPVIGGIALRRFAGRLIQRILPLLPWLSAVAIALVVGIIMGGSADRVAEAGLLVLTAVIAHNALGLASGWVVGRLVGLDAASRRALTFEVGLQNSGLAASLSTMYFSPLTALPAAVFSLWHNLSGSVVAALMSRRSTESAAES